MIALIDKFDEQFITLFEMLDGTESWENGIIYANSFSFNGVKEL